LNYHNMRKYFISIFVILMFNSTTNSQNYKTYFSQLNVDLTKPPETIDLTIKAFIGKWISLDPLNKLIIDVSIVDKPLYDTGQKKDDFVVKPIGTVKKIQFFYTEDNRRFGPTESYKISTPGKIEVSFYGYLTTQLNIQFSNYNRLVVNNNFIFKRLN
jgi:hypothetical protein